MDPLSVSGAARTGGWIGATAGQEILKYDSSIYQARIDELGRIKNTLDGHLDNLKSLKAEVNSFWDDSLGGDVTSVVDEWIKKLNEANRKIEIMQRTFRERMEDFDASIAESQETIDALKGISGAGDL